MRVRKKPVVVDAWQIDIVEFENQGAMPQWVWEAWGQKLFLRNNKIEITTLEGDMTADDRDYLIKGVAGELYSIKKDIFEKTYDVVEDENSEAWGGDFEYDTGFKIPPAKKPTQHRKIELTHVRDLEDGGAIYIFDMDADSIRLFAKKGIMQALVEEADRVMKEHGDA